MPLDPIAEKDADVGGEAHHGPAPKEVMHLQPDVVEAVTDPMIQADQDQIMEAAQDQTQQVGQTLLMKTAQDTKMSHISRVEEAHDPALGAAQCSIAPEAKESSVEANHDEAFEVNTDPQIQAFKNPGSEESKVTTVKNDQHTVITQHTLDVEPATDGLKERIVPVLSTRPPKVSR